MRRISLCLSLFALTLLVITACSPRVEVNPDRLKYFQDSYEECREAFRELSEKLREEYRDVEVSHIPVLRKTDRGFITDRGLTIDYCYIPAKMETERLFILTSGLHGIEGFAGSAVQQMFMAEMIPKLNLDETGILLIHGINPWGFKNRRRVTQNNVDLNRNFDVADDLFKTKNEGYAKIRGFLNPTETVDMGSIKNRFFLITAVTMIAKHGMSPLRQAILQGQYEYEKGIYFGGKEFEQQKKVVRHLLQSTSAPYSGVFIIDLHTGYGAWGKTHLFPNPIKDAIEKERTIKVFDGWPIDFGDTEGFYTTKGDFLDWSRKILNKGIYVNMVLEYGTMDSQTTVGSVNSVHRTILENQGYHYGYESGIDEKMVRNRYREMFYPSSREWRSMVLDETHEILTRAIPAFQKL